MTDRVRRQLVLLASFAFSQLALLLVLRPPEAPGDGSVLAAFRAYFSYDQLSYAAIASTTAAGNSGLPEPFTETGQSFYPSLWYRIIGWVAAATGATVPAVWTIAGGLLIAAALVVIGVVAYRISGLPWSPALVGPVLAVGTMSVALLDNWYTPLASHAVLWGPFGALYVLNAEVAGFACVSVALALILRTTVVPPRSPSGTMVRLSAAALLLGVTANLQTYIFFVGAGIAFSWLGAYGLLRSRSRGLLGASGVLLLLTLVFGNAISQVVGALPVYGLFIACTLPGALWLAARHLRIVAIPAVLFVLAATPQALVVASGVLADDPFLAYRQEASDQLGVPLVNAVIAALPIIAVWVFNLRVAWPRRGVPVIAALAGVAFSGTMLSFNGLWGFGQEPYRMWIDSYLTSWLLLAPVTAWSLAGLLTGGQELRSRALAVTGAVAIGLIGVAVLDFGAFRAYVRDSGLIRFDAARYQALDAVTASVDGLLSSGPCIDPQELKVATRKPVAFYNAGIAWPEDKPAIDAVVDAWRAGVYDPDAMRAANVRYLVTDSACATQWPVAGSMGVIEDGSLDYADAAGSGTLTLWRIR